MKEAPTEVASSVRYADGIAPDRRLSGIVSNCRFLPRVSTHCAQSHVLCQRVEYAAGSNSCLHLVEVETSTRNQS
jgi:hypothetical protein